MSKTIVIVTKKCYLLAEQIHYVTMTEASRHDYIIPKAKKYWQIVICFTPEDQPNANGGISRSRDEKQTVTVLMDNLDVAHKLHTEIVQQIRKQMPDQLFLDQVIDNFLEGGPLDVIDESTTKIRRVRKEKRRSKKVLRGAKAGKRRAR